MKQHLGSLTSVRFIAAVWVVLYHVCGYRNGLIDSGYIGVTLFFVLSGFILTYTYSGRNLDRGKFWAARFARIYPVYAVGLILAAPSFAHEIHGRGLLGATFTAPLLLQAWHPAWACDWNPAGWSLSVEAFFYALFPLLLPLVTRRRAVWLWLASIVPTVAYLLIRPDGMIDIHSHALWLSSLKYNPVMRLSEFVVGIAIGQMFVSGVRIPKARRVALSATLAIVALASCPLPYPLLHNGLLAPLFAVLILALASVPSALSWSPLVLAGEASYSLYILHLPVFHLLHHVAHLDPMHSVIHFAIYLVVSVGASILAYRFIELPCRNALRSVMIRKQTAGQLVAAGSV